MIDLDSLQNVPHSAAAKSELKWNIWLELMDFTAIGEVYSKCGKNVNDSTASSTELIIKSKFVVPSICRCGRLSIGHRKNSSASKSAWSDDAHSHQRFYWLVAMIEVGAKSLNLASLIFVLQKLKFRQGSCM